MAPKVPDLRQNPHIIFSAVAMATKLQKVPLRILLERKEKNQNYKCRDIELKFGIETTFGPLSSKSNINLQFGVIMTFSAFRPFR